MFNDKPILIFKSVSQGIPPSWVNYIKSAIEAFENSGKRTYQYGSSENIASSIVSLSNQDQISHADTVYTPSIMLWNPLIQFSAYSAIECPICRGQLKVWRWKDGSSARETPRSLICLQKKVYLVSCVYLCEQNQHEIVGHDPAIITTLQNTFPFLHIPFILFHKSGVTRELYDFISSSIQSGLSLIDIESIITQQHSARHYRDACEYTAYKKLNNIVNLQEFPAFDPAKEYISRKLIFRVFLKSFVEVEHMYTEHMASKRGKWISADHTFKVKLYITCSMHESLLFPFAFYIHSNIHNLNRELKTYFTKSFNILLFIFFVIMCNGKFI